MNIIEKLNAEVDNYRRIADQNSTRADILSSEGRAFARRDMISSAEEKFTQASFHGGKAAGYSSAAASLRSAIKEIENEIRNETENKPSYNNTVNFSSVTDSGNHRTETINSSGEPYITYWRGV